LVNAERKDLLVSVTLRDHDDRAMLRLERRLAHPIKKVWRAVTTPEEMVHWFPAALEYDQRVGAPITFSFPHEAAESSNGQVVELDPPHVFAFLWDEELMRIELTPDGPNACFLVFTHIFDDRPGAASFATGWSVCLDALRMVLDGAPVQVSGGWDGMHDQHETFIAEFGLNVGTSEETPEGWRVRFERQLTRPVVEVWAMLTASSTGAPAIGGPVPRAFAARDTPAGAITALDAPTLLEYDWQFEGRSAGRVRWELSDGPGGAARLVLTQTGPSKLADERAKALMSWQAHIEQLAGQRQGAAR
jgi:uncharacterized protein YndB with AHSA1/START domain